MDARIRDVQATDSRALSEPRRVGRRRVRGGSRGPPLFRGAGGEAFRPAVGVAGGYSSSPATL